jgi:hypothetical protein
VRGGERAGDLDRPIEEIVVGHRLARDAVVESGAFEEFERQEGPAFELADVKDRTDTGMTERRCGASLALEAFQSERVAGKVVREKLEGEAASESCILGFENDSHAAAADPAEDSIMGNRLADHQGTVYAVRETRASYPRMSDILKVYSSRCTSKNNAY